MECQAGFPVQHHTRRTCNPISRRDGIVLRQHLHLMISRGKPRTPSRLLACSLGSTLRLLAGRPRRWQLPKGHAIEGGPQRYRTSLPGCTDSEFVGDCSPRSCGRILAFGLPCFCEHGGAHVSRGGCGHFTKPRATRSGSWRTVAINECCLSEMRRSLLEQAP